MVAELGEENPAGGGPGTATAGIEIPVEAMGQQPAAGGAPLIGGGDLFCV